MASKSKNIEKATALNRSLSSAPFLYRTLTRKMVAVIVLVSFTPLFLISGFILEQFNRSYKEKVHAHLGELVEKHRQHIDGFLNEQLDILRFLADSHPLDQLHQETFLSSKLSQLQFHFSGVFEDLGIVDDHGLQVAYAGPFKLIKANYANADWFKKVMIRQYFISDVFLGLRGMPHFIVATRLEHQGRQWILRATINFMAFNNLVENLRIGETGFAFILNKSEAYQTKPPKGAVPNSDQYSKFLNNTGNDPQQIRIFETTEDAGRSNINVGAFLKSGEWLLIYQQDTSDAYRDLNHARKVAIIIIFVGGIFIISTAIFISHRMVNRLASAEQEKKLMSRQVVETGKLASIGELAAGIAHEINNPVAIMMEKAGWIQDLLEEEEFKDGENLSEFEDSLEEIRNQARRCKEITHKLLSFARKTDSRPKDMQLNDLLEDVIGLSEQRAKYAGVVFKKNLDARLPAIQASPTEMQQVFLNLINNALDAMDKDGGEVKITSADNGTCVTVAITDTGPGIPGVIIERIFDPFFTTKPVGRGTGLGLSICYGIIKKLGGDIEVESEIDKGTRFLVSIPKGEKTIAASKIASDER